MALDIDFDADMAALVADLGDSLTWPATDGADYACVRSPITDRSDMENLAGLSARPFVQVMVQTSLFDGAWPDEGDKAQLGGETYRITQVETCESDAALLLTLEDVTQ